ncbi:hypothetical protein PBI_SARFIRE_55 [Mycobacterium phage SarFire]|nr:hypothetical protein P765_gp55 [Mycobacterium phage SarFire]AGT20586.1 hypothetical protein PBI_SARFIRE_55 [Mycobacterium phage SarFire]AJA43630.1 hypothetical protein PBI_THOR_55 [Mycobacterium phage Thor]AZF97269.1 hypothetical protein SEA_FROGHOPPER_55 [Mycobacterium phage Froghopper]
MNQPVPTARPNLLRQQLLGALLDPRKYALARNVSEHSVDRTARRWGR